jgi:hypothetical protein
MISPSSTTYSFPSMAILPASRQAGFVLILLIIRQLYYFSFDKPAFKICMDHTSCLRGLKPLLMVQARTSFSPAVK